MAETPVLAAAERGSGLAGPHDLTTFARNLCWAGPLLDCCRAWLDACGDLLDRRLRAHCERNPRLAWLLAAYPKWPQDLRRDFLLSPQVSQQLRIREDGHVPTFAAMAPDFVRVLARSSSGAATDPDVAEMLAAFGQKLGDVKGIPLDFDSTLSFPSCGANAGEPRPLRADRAVQAQRCLQAPLESLEQGSPIALEFVRLLTRRLVVREESPAENSASCIFGHLMGLTLLTNPWAAGIDAAHLIDALVHEAIHAGLFFYEAVRGSLFLPKGCVDPIPSPWTGKQLTCDQYVQACFVWFGLAHLWGSWPAGTDGVSSERARQLHRRAVHGFLARPVQALLGHSGGHLVPPLVRDALAALEQDALEAWDFPERS